jgi:UDP-N-acetylmuramoyl-tripeptide--D-alanyl-D-alanine ligase
MIDLRILKNCTSVLEPVQDLKLLLNICTDTRKYTHPSGFVAIPGEKVNPLDMIDALLTQECPIVFYQQDSTNEEKVRNLASKYSKTRFVAVKDSVTFLQELTHEHVKQWKLKSPKNTIFAISGSNGKTTHKEMLSHMLKTVLPGKIVATEKNNNNHLGVPLTLLNVNDQTEFVVLELGSNHPGEIKVLCDIAQPNAGLTTNIGATHLEFFGSEEKVFQEEAYLYYAVKSVTQGQGFYLINLDDPFLSSLPKTAGSFTYGLSHQADIKISYLETGAECSWSGKKLIVENAHITGNHNKLNLITCLFIANHFYPELKQKFVEAGKEFRPTKNRSEWIEFEKRSVYLDAYNANPSSMKAALSGFKDSILSQGFKLADSCIVLGDMNELGDSASHYHEEVGAYVKSLGFPNVFFVGRYSQFYKKGFPGGQEKLSSAAFKNEYRSDCIKKFSIHFIKGSRSLQLESLFDIT